MEKCPVPVNVQQRYSLLAVPVNRYGTCECIVEVLLGGVVLVDRPTVVLPNKPATQGCHSQAQRTLIGAKRSLNNDSKCAERLWLRRVHLRLEVSLKPTSLLPRCPSKLKHDPQAFMSSPPLNCVMRMAEIQLTVLQPWVIEMLRFPPVSDLKRPVLLFCQTAAGPSEVTTIQAKEKKVRRTFTRGELHAYWTLKGDS